MTYCVGIKLDDGLVFASDSRTSAGVDYISVFNKTHQFSIPNEREIFILSAGNLGTTQEVIALLRREIERGIEHNILKLDSIFDIAIKLGATLQEVVAKIPPKAGVDFTSSFILGGKIKGEPIRLFKIYPEGNFIEATPETPFFQIGESKYGKPILDRIISSDLSVDYAINCTLVSFDSTMKSNLSVGLPINLSVLRESDSVDSVVNHPQQRVIDEEDSSFIELRKKWNILMQQSFSQLAESKWFNV